MDCDLSDESSSYPTEAFPISVLPEKQRSELGQTLSQNKHPSHYLLTDGQVEMRAWEAWERSVGWGQAGYGLYSSRALSVLVGR